LISSSSRVIRLYLHVKVYAAINAQHELAINSKSISCSFRRLRIIAVATVSDHLPGHSITVRFAEKGLQKYLGICP
jgi:hypothetical protein